MPREVGSFSKDSRLLRSEEFRKVGRRAVRQETSHFILLKTSRNPKPSNTKGLLLPNRLGITASRKAGNAVIRNRTKRLLREWFRSRQFVVGTEIDIVIILKKNIGYLYFTDVCSELEKVFAS